jgi:predicted O-methyltransferase YrrM
MKTTKKENPNIKDGQTLLTRQKVHKLLELLSKTENIDGSIAEVGVYKGGTAKLIADRAGESKVFLFDTFEGMPNYTENVDNHWGLGSFNNTDFDSIKEIFKGYKNVSLCKGIFPDESGYVIENESFRFVHLDVDNYKSYKDSLAFIYEKMAKGGIIVFDDYNCDCCPGANKAIDEFFQGKEKINYDISAYIIKL